MLLNSPCSCLMLYNYTAREMCLAVLNMETVAMSVGMRAYGSLRNPAGRPELRNRNSQFETGISGSQIRLQVLLVDKAHVHVIEQYH